MLKAAITLSENDSDWISLEDDALVPPDQRYVMEIDLMDEKMEEYPNKEEEDDFVHIESNTLTDPGEFQAICYHDQIWNRQRKKLLRNREEWYQQTFHSPFTLWPQIFAQFSWYRNMIQRLQRGEKAVFSFHLRDSVFVNQFLVEKASLALTYLTTTSHSLVNSSESSSNSKPSLTYSPSPAPTPPSPYPTPAPPPSSSLNSIDTG